MSNKSETQVEGQANSLVSSKNEQDNRVLQRILDLDLKISAQDKRIEELEATISAQDIKISTQDTRILTLDKKISLLEAQVYFPF